MGDKEPLPPRPSTGPPTDSASESNEGSVISIDPPETSNYLDGVAHAFVSAHRQTPDSFFNYLSQLAGLIREESKSISRDIVLTFILIFLFQLLSSKGVAEAEIFAVKISDFFLVLLIIPVAISVVFARVASTARKREAMVNLHDAIVAARFGDDYEKIDAVYDASVMAHFSGALIHPMPDGLISGERSKRIQEVLTSVDSILVAVSPPVVLVYLYARLFMKFGLSSVHVWSSAAVAILILATAYITFAIDIETGSS